MNPTDNIYPRCKVWVLYLLVLRHILQYTVSFFSFLPFISPILPFLKPQLGHSQYPLLTLPPMISSICSRKERGMYSNSQPHFLHFILSLLFLAYLFGNENSNYHLYLQILHSYVSKLDRENFLSLLIFLHSLTYILDKLFFQDAHIHSEDTILRCLIPPAYIQGT